jgi:Mg-chelatase subunit ChlD
MQLQDDAAIERESKREQGIGRRPLRRRPKQLEDAPRLFTRGGGAPGAVVGGARDRARDGRRREGSGATIVTNEAGSATEAEDDPGARDAEVHRFARAIAARLSARRSSAQVPRIRGRGELVSARYRTAADDIDLDRTLELLAERRPLRSDEIIVRDRRRVRRAVVLAVDVSGSMRGERVRTAAATVGAVVSELARDEIAVIAFWSDAAVLVELGERVDAGRIVDRLLAIPAQGLTNVVFPLEVAAEQLRRTPDHDSRVILLSDCVHNAGPDPRPVAAGLPRLDVLFDVTGERDTDMARDLARAGRGRLFPIRTHRDVAPALSSILSG